VIDSDELFVQLNDAGIALCARPPTTLIGMPAPFELAQGFSWRLSVSSTTGATSRCACGLRRPVSAREFAYRTERWLVIPR